MCVYTMLYIYIYRDVYDMDTYTIYLTSTCPLGPRPRAELLGLDLGWSGCYMHVCVHMTRGCGWQLSIYIYMYIHICLSLHIYIYICGWYLFVYVAVSLEMLEKARKYEKSAKLECG